MNGTVYETAAYKGRHESEAGVAYSWLDELRDSSRHTQRHTQAREEGRA